MYGQIGFVSVRIRTGLILEVLQPPILYSDSMGALRWAIHSYFSLWARDGDMVAPGKLH